MVKQVCIEILATQVSITSSSFDGKDTTLDTEQRHIESATTEIVDEDVPRLLLLARSETISNSCGSWLVDNSEDVETRDSACIFCSLSLVVVEVCWNCNDGLLDLLAELGLSHFLHLHEHHGGDLLGREDLGLFQVFDLNHWVAALVNDLEWPRLDILLDCWVVESSSDETSRNRKQLVLRIPCTLLNLLDIEDCVGWVHSSLVLCGLTNQSFLIGK